MVILYLPLLTLISFSLSILSLCLILQDSKPCRLQHQTPLASGFAVQLKEKKIARFQRTGGEISQGISSLLPFLFHNLGSGIAAAFYIQSLDKWSFPKILALTSSDNTIPSLHSFKPERGTMTLPSWFPGTCPHFFPLLNYILLKTSEQICFLPEHDSYIGSVID